MGSSLGRACHCVCGGGSAAPRKRPAVPPAALLPLESPPPSDSAASASAGPESSKTASPAGLADGTWLFSTLLLAVLATGETRLATATGIPPLVVRGLLLAAVAIHMYLRSSRSSESATSVLEPSGPEPIAKRSLDGGTEVSPGSSEAPLDQLKRLLAEAELQFGGGEAGGQPSTEQEYRAQGWQCDRTSTSQVFSKFPKDPAPARVLGDIRLNTIDQVPEFPIAIVNEEGELRGGAAPVYLSVGTWPSWFPFMHKCTKLGTLTDYEEIWHVEAKIAMFKADCVVMGSYQDRLDDLGQLQVVFITPPQGSEGQEWLGITVPQKVGPLRVPLNKMRLCLKPVTKGTSVVHFQVDYVDILGLEWVAKMVFKTLSQMVVPKIRDQIDAFAGSALEAFLRAPENYRRRDLYMEMHQRVKGFVARRNAAGVGSIPP
mmetsp:Transcript_154877/g.288824  ORF Transcript_154877/g.288824 Transcript_154877/m.288824 type:complete len:431 (-) Transcript_154877:50-1342(-)